MGGLVVAQVPELAQGAALVVILPFHFLPAAGIAPRKCPFPPFAPAAGLCCKVPHGHGFLHHRHGNNLDARNGCVKSPQQAGRSFLDA